MQQANTALALKLLVLIALQEHIPWQELRIAPNVRQAINVPVLPAVLWFVAQETIPLQVRPRAVNALPDIFVRSPAFPR